MGDAVDVSAFITRKELEALVQRMVQHEAHREVQRLCDQFLMRQDVMIGVVERCVPWMQDKIAAEVRRQLQREVPAALQEDSRMQKLQEAMLSRVEDRVHQVSQKVLDQLVQENRYQHINAALLRDLQVRGDAILEHNEQGLIKLHGQHQEALQRLEEHSHQVLEHNRGAYEHRVKSLERWQNILLLSTVVLGASLLYVTVLRQ